MKNLKNFTEYIAEKSNKCDNCGAPLSSKDVVCKYCGVEHEKEFEKPEKEWERPKVNSKSSNSKVNKLTSLENIPSEVGGYFPIS